MNITQRQSVLGVLILLTSATLLLVIALLIPSLSNGLDNGSLAIAGIISLVIQSVLLFAYIRGWEYARYVVVIFLTLAVAIATPDPFVKSYASITIFVPPALALILAEPIWVLGSTGLLYVIMLVRAGGEGTYTNPITMLLYIIVVGSMVVARLVTDTALRQAKENALHIEEARLFAEKQANELADANELMGLQLDQQQSLLDLVATLETPAVALANGVLFAPIVGHIDSRRAQELTNRLLKMISVERSQLLIIDITGVTVIDTTVAQALMNMTQAVRLLGCSVTLSGISAAVALTLIQLGVSFDGISTVRSPQEALARHFDKKLGAVAPAHSNNNPKNPYS